MQPNLPSTESTPPVKSESPPPSVASLTKSFQHTQVRENPPERPVIFRDKKHKIFAG